jgi:hypothetical protein
MSAEAETPTIGAVHQSMVSGIEVARSALEEAKRKLAEYDAQHIGAAEKANAYLTAAIDGGHAALAELVIIAEGMKAGSAELPVQAISVALAKVHGAFEHLSSVANQYDEQYNLSSRVSSVVANPKQQATGALATVGAYASAVAASANAQLQGVSDGLRSSLSKAATQSSDAQGGSVLMERVRDLDEKFGISGYLGSAAGPAQSLDQKVTGGKISQAILGAYHLGWNMVTTVQSYTAKKEEPRQASP